MPAAGYCTAECVHSSLLVDGDVGGVRKYNAGGADGGECLSVLDNAGPHCRRSIIACASDYGGADLESGQFSSLLCNSTRDLRGFVHLCQQRFVYSQLVQHLVGPAAVRDIQQLHSAGVGYLGGILAGEHEADIVLGQEDMTALLVILRLVVLHPHDLCGGESGDGWISGDLDHSVSADFIGDLNDLPGGTLIAPDDGFADRLVLSVQHYKSVHLAG